MFSENKCLLPLTCVPRFRLQVDARTARHIRRLQRAFANARINPYHWTGSSGYGRGDPGREALEEVHNPNFRKPYNLT